MRKVRVTPVYRSRGDDPERRGRILHYSDLNRGSVRAKQKVAIALNVKGILHLPCGMVFGDI